MRFGRFHTGPPGYAGGEPDVFDRESGLRDYPCGIRADAAEKRISTSGVREQHYPTVYYGMPLVQKYSFSPSWILRCPPMLAPISAYAGLMFAAVTPTGVKLLAALTFE
jgi:hypothetical protein